MDIYKPQHKVRIVTAASLFDGHDAAINIMRRIIQATGCEVIHLGHNRSVQEIVNCAIQEDVQGIAITSYQGGHTEYFKYMHDLLKENGAGHIKLFGGGGGVILPEEIAELHAYGITRIYSPDDGRHMGLQGMINDLVQTCDFPTVCNLKHVNWEAIPTREAKEVAKAITFAENHTDEIDAFHEKIKSLQNKDNKNIPVLGITGTGGAGKSSLVDELVRRFLNEFDDKTLAIISVDPSKRKTGGALLGDRIRMNSINNPRVYMRSMATRESNLALSPHVKDAIDVCKTASYDLVILESAGIGQADSSVVDLSDVALYVMTPEFGAATQLEKIDMIDYADLIAINKFDKKGALDALRDVKKQYKRSRQLWNVADEEIPVFGTMASQFNDPGVNNLFKALMDKVAEKTGADLKANYEITEAMSEKIYVVPPARSRYLAEIVENAHAYRKFAREQSALATQLYQLKGTIELLENQNQNTDNLKQFYADIEERLHADSKRLLREWPEMQRAYTQDDFVYKVRNKDIHVPMFTESLSHLKVPKVSLPKFKDWGDVLYWLFMENVPGRFPYAAGVYPFKRTEEDPTRMFAGEGGPERTNRRFHYVSKGLPAKRLSTAFDSVTLYGEDPDHRPDIYGKVGNSGVSIASVDDAKKLYSGFNLADPRTSVSMTINGPAPMLLGFFMNAAVDQQCEIYIKQNGLEEEVEAKIAQLYKEKGIERPRYNGDLPEGNDGLGLMLLGVSGDEVLDAETYARIKAETLSSVRGTVQADILKEDQAQNTCIFSIEFALRTMRIIICPKTALFIILLAERFTLTSISLCDILLKPKDLLLTRLCITASTIITAPSTINPKSSAPRLIKFPLTPKIFIIITANSIDNGITEATKIPARKLPRNNTRTKITISAPSSRFLETVPIALLTIFVRSRKGSSSTPSGKVFWIAAIFSFTSFITRLLLSPFSIITTAPATSPSSL